MFSVFKKHGFSRAIAASAALLLLIPMAAFGDDPEPLAIPGQNEASAEEMAATPVVAESAVPTTGTINVMIELHEAPAAVVLDEVTRVEGRAMGLAKGKAHAAKLADKQREVSGKIRSQGLKVKEIYSMQRAFNGIAAEVDAADIPELVAMPEVKSVMPLVEHHPDAASSNPFMRVEAFWNALPSGLRAKGEGVRVGIIDSGIDYLHTAFGGPGTAAAYAAVTDKNAAGFFPNAKVVGGWDFVGDTYTGGSANLNPDSNPFERVNGHGTAVASLIAGLGVNADGTTYTGPYDGSTNYAPLRVSPGVAPGALIYALRVFGNSGSTSVTHQAIEWAMDPDGDGDMSDRLDVINLSLGSQNGHPDDLTARTADAATKAGSVVVISAGNAYNIYYITGSPSVADGAISVAASINDQFYHTLRITSPASLENNYLMIPASFGPTFPLAGLSRQLVLADPIVGINDSNAALNNAAALAGKIAVMERGGGIGFTTKVRNAQNSGAVGVIMINNIAGAPITMGGTDPLVAIPSAMISQMDGDILRPAISAGSAVASASSTPNANGADTMAVYSSRGPRRGDSALKPDITGPAELVSAAAVGTGAGVRTFNGTSSAAPHVAGGMALMRQVNPTWTADELKALAMNTARFGLFSDVYQKPPMWNFTRVGSGRIDLQGAARSKVIAFNKDRPDLVSISYGQIEASEPLNLVRHVSVRNKGNSRATYLISFEPNATLPGVSLEFDSRKDISIPAGVTNHFPVKLRVNPAALQNVRDPLVPATERISTATSPFSFPRHFLNEFAGHVVLTPRDGSSPTLRVPVWAAVRPAAAMTTGGAVITMDAESGTTNVPVSGQELNTAGTATPSFPTDIVGLVKGFELQYEAAENPAITGYMKAAEIQYAGVTSDYRTRGNVIGSTSVTFGLSSYGDWDTPSASGVMLRVLVTNDVTGNPNPVTNVIVFTNAPNDLDTSTSSPSTSNVFTTYRTVGATTSFFPALPVNGLTPAAINTYAMNNRVMAITIPASSLNLTTAQPRFRYKVQGVWRGLIISQSPDWILYDVTRPGLDTSGTNNLEPFWYFDTNGNTVPVRWNRANYLANGSKGLLLLHPHNTAGLRAEKVAVEIP